jgi:hypothetical protein
VANGFQRVIYNLANAVPLAVMTALAWHLEFKSWGVPAILIVAAATVTVLFAICFSYGRKNCSVKSINVSKITSKDSWLVAYVIAYVLPFAYMVMSDYHIVSLIVAVLMLILVFIPANLLIKKISPQALETSLSSSPCVYHSIVFSCTFLGKTLA